MKKIKLLTFLILALKVVNPAFAQLALTPSVQMNFGTIEFTNASGWSRSFLGTDGVVSYANGFSGEGLGTPGVIQILSPSGLVVQISCRKSLYLSNGSQTAKINQIEYVVGAVNATSFGNGIRCAGLKRYDSVHIVTGNAIQDSILVGGRLRVQTSNVSSGQWSSLNAGGSSVRFRVIAQ